MGNICELLCGSKGTDGIAKTALDQLSGSIDHFSTKAIGFLDGKAPEDLQSFGPFCVRVLLENACAAILGRLDSFRLLYLSEFQSQPQYDPVRRARSAFSWMGDVKGEDTKAFHHRFERIGLQESSPQNNFRRIIACRIPSGQFCNHKINYTTSNHSQISLELVLFVLNSSFADWYFRLGSTNAAVSHYQLENIPCPRFGEQSGNADKAFCKTLDALIDAKDFSVIKQKCTDLAVQEGCSPTMERALESLVRFIEREEAARGRIARSERSRLAEDAEQCQVVLDKMMLILLGLGEGKHNYLRARLKEML